MKLVTKCSACSEKIKLSNFMIYTRFDLAKKRGKEFDLRCERCGQINHVHVDEVKAVKGWLVELVGLISVILAVLLIIWFWGSGFITIAAVAIPIIAIKTIYNNQHYRINQFNLMYYDSQRQKK